MPFDVLNPERFAGPGHSGEDCFSRVLDRAYRETEYGRVADPSVVSYTRLLVPKGQHGELYLDRMLCDRDAGAPSSWVEESLPIAERFGTAEKVRARLRDLEELAESLR